MAVMRNNAKDVEIQNVKGNDLEEMEVEIEKVQEAAEAMEIEEIGMVEREDKPSVVPSTRLVFRKEIRAYIVEEIKTVVRGIAPQQEGENEQSGYIQPHPLLIYNVLKNLEQHLGTADLKVCRLVCKVWDDTFQPSVRANATVRFDARDNRKVAEFVQAARDEGDCYDRRPYRNFVLQAGCDLSLVELCGPHVTTLELCNICFESWDQFQFILFYCFRGLQGLTMNNVSGVLPGKEDVYPLNWNLKYLAFKGKISVDLPWLIFYQHYIRLQLVDFLGDASCTEAAILALCQEFSEKDKSIQLNRISFLEEHGEKFNIEFTSLTITIFDKECVKILRNVLIRYLFTLEKLTIIKDSHPVLPIYESPVYANVPLVALTSLTLCNRTFPDLSFLQSMPNLVNFNILHKWNEKRNGCNIVACTKSTVVKVTRLVSCTTLQVQHPLSRMELRKLNSMFPNVVHLKVHALCESMLIADFMKSHFKKVTDPTYFQD